MNGELIIKALTFTPYLLAREAKTAASICLVAGNHQLMSLKHIMAPSPIAALEGNSQMVGYD